MRFCFLFIAAIFLCTGCQKKTININASQQPLGFDFDEASAMYYRFAYTGQVYNANSREVVTVFSVEVVGKDPSISVINPLGNSNGIFHISRNPGWKDFAFKTVQLVLSSPGFETFVHRIELGSDCQSVDCEGSIALPFFLKPSQSTVQGTVPFSVDQLSPSLISQLLSSQGTSQIFNQLIGMGKLDPLISDLLSKAKNKDMISSVLVLLNGTGGINTSKVVNGLLKNIPSEHLTGLSSISELLPYLQPYLNGQSVNDNVQQLAMTTLIPALTGFLSTKPNQNAFDMFLASVLTDPGLLSAVFSIGKNGLVGMGDQQIAQLLTYVTPLLQGLTGKNSGELCRLFNQLIQSGGINAIKELAKGGNAKERFAKILPYLDPLIKGLTGKDATQLTSLLMPILSGKDPALALQSLLTITKKSKVQNVAAVASVVYPALQTVLKQCVSGKQLFSAQLLLGLTYNDFSNVQVLQDLASLPVIVMGQARDIFKIASLPNVDKLILLNK